MKQVLYTIPFLLLWGCSSQVKIEEVFQSNHRWTGVAVSIEGRTFVNFPRWSSIPFSVAEIIDGKLSPYPNAEWNKWGDSITVHNHFACVQSIYIDDQNYLWVVDAGVSMQTGVLTGAPKLLKKKKKKNTILKIYQFPESIIYGSSYLNDIRVDTKSNFAYLTESGLGSLIVVDLNTGSARRLLNRHQSTKAENIKLIINGKEVEFPVHVDGLALSNNKKYLYYKALTGKKLWRIPTTVLMDSTIKDSIIDKKVEFVANTLPSDAIEFDRRGNLYFTAIEQNALYKLLPDGEFEILVKDSRFTWPDSFSLTKKDEIFFTTSGIMFPSTTHYIFKLNL